MTTLPPPQVTGKCVLRGDYLTPQRDRQRCPNKCRFTPLRSPTAVANRGMQREQLFIWLHRAVTAIQSGFLCIPPQALYLSEDSVTHLNKAFIVVHILTQRSHASFGGELE
ncbi:hypothetical protein EVAR_40149_1 [Eumeta japonica]|uniref:Uncharacterized protein n=1 Tax=Eumeta variegata TaxID=151549 RepID=A0A4C1YI54_EUMVA|nr:hypothetical protein EVAR_40149_1 [Eumeta japonica]